MKSLNMYMPVILLLNLLCMMPGYTDELTSTDAVGNCSSILSASLSRARMFSPAGNAKLSGIQDRLTGPPFVQCYKFTVPLSTIPLSSEQAESPAGIMESSANATQSFEATILAEKDTGRIVEYRPDMKYILLKRRGSPNVVAINNISRIQAESLAQTVLKSAGVFDSSIRLGSLNLSKQPAYAVYDISFEKYAVYSGIGDVQLPFSALFVIDAVTGNVDYYGLKEYPVTIKLIKPSISKDHAIEALVKELKATDIQSVSAHLAITFDYSGISDEAAELSLSAPRDFYEQISKNRQVLAWRIHLRGKYKTNWGKAEAVDLDTQAYVNAITGKVISAILPK